MVSRGHDVPRGKKPLGFALAGLGWCVCVCVCVGDRVGVCVAGWWGGGRWGVVGWGWMEAVWLEWILVERG